MVAPRERVEVQTFVLSVLVTDGNGFVRDSDDLTEIGEIVGVIFRLFINAESLVKLLPPALAPDADGLALDDLGIHLGGLAPVGLALTIVNLAGDAGDDDGLGLGHLSDLLIAS